VQASALARMAHRSLSRAACADQSNVESHRSKKLRRVVFAASIFSGSLQTFVAPSQLRNASVMFGD
jgi:hypothetical protein